MLAYIWLTCCHISGKCFGMAGQALQYLFLHECVQFWQNVCNDLWDLFNLHVSCDVLFEI